MYNFLNIGVDLRVHENGQIYFLEANSYPVLMEEYEELYGNCRPLEALVESLKSLNKKIILVYAEKYFNENPEPKHFLKKFNELNKKGCDACLLDYKDYKKKIISNDGKEFDKGIIFCSKLDRIKTIVNNDSNFLVVNIQEIRKITKDKILCNEILENYSNVKVPKTWVFRTPKKLKEILENSGFKKLIIKPVFGKQGEGIEMIDKNTIFDKIKLGTKTWMAQEYISVVKKNGENWDLRVFVVNGKYAGAVTRMSKTIATNVHLGGRVEKLDEEIEEKIAKIAEETVKTFEEYFLSR